MIQKTQVVAKTFTAAGAITAGAIVMFSSSDDTVVVGTAATDLLIGLALHAAASGERVEVQIAGVGECKLGGTVTRGGMVTSGAAGVGVALSAAATVKSSIGVAMASGVTGDIIPLLIAPAWSTTA